MKKGMLRFLIAISCTCSLFSCKKNVHTDDQADSGNRDAVYNYIKKLGYRDADIQDLGKQYVVDGDILFDKAVQPDLSVFDGPKEEQYGTANYIDYNLQPNVRYLLSGSGLLYSLEIGTAVANWNSIPNCRLKLGLSTFPGAGQIEFRVASLAGTACGQAYYPMNGLPGSLIYLDREHMAALTYERRVALIQHYIMHAVGFRHSDWLPKGEAQTGLDNGAFYDAMHIMGTATQGGDVTSLMQAGICNTILLGLSQADVLALQFLYPANPPVAGTVPVFRYYGRDSNQDHFYTMHYGEIGGGSNWAYIFEGIGFHAFATQVPNSVPIYRYYSASTGNHFYSAYQENNGWPLEGIGFYAYTSAINGARPVYRYYSPSRGDHFYTLNPNELATMPGYVSEGIGWYAY
jgi:hypothetical protein